MNLIYKEYNKSTDFNNRQLSSTRSNTDYLKKEQKNDSSKL